MEADDLLNEKCILVTWDTCVLKPPALCAMSRTHYKEFNMFLLVNRESQAGECGPEQAELWGLCERFAVGEAVQSGGVQEPQQEQQGAWLEDWVQGTVLAIETY